MPPGAVDVAIIGAGVVGTAIARELTRYDLSIVVVDAATDVGTGTTKANTAILHTGFDAVPGSLESRLLRRGSALLRDYATRAGIPVERTGALLVAWTAEQRRALPEIEEKARRNG
jgi:glycerol-3-phosphate dehydrogenase